MSEVRRIGRYDAVVPIGTGGMATVYLASEEIADGVARQVALKLVHPHLRESEGASATLLEEAKLAARIHHRNVVPVREVGEASEGIYLVMDYIEGATLSKLVKKAGSVPLPIAARILSEALSGLHAAHELTGEEGSSLELVHRDFSPQNVLVGVDGVTRLTDFGIAKAASRAGVTSTGVVKGKVGYLSPEQALGKPLDRRSDVWAAGIVGWELLAGRRLYDADAEPVSAIMRIVSETPPRLRTVRPELSPLVEQVIATALTLDPKRRWPSADEMSRALLEAFRADGAIADHEQVGEWVRAQVGDELATRREVYRRHVGPSLRAARSRVRPRRRLGVVLGCAAVLGVAVGAWAVTRRTAPAEPVIESFSSAPPEVTVSPIERPPPLPTVPESTPPTVVVADDAGSRPRTATRRTLRPRSTSGAKMPPPGPNPYRP